MSHHYRGRKLGEMKPDGYVSSDIEPGDEITWNDWRDGSYWTSVKNHQDAAAKADGHQPFTLIPYSHGSDYSGTLVERSNYQCLVDNHGDEVVTVSGDYGTFGVGFLGSAAELSEDLQDVIAGLHDYPLADESLHSEMEWEVAMEAWNDHGHEDFRRALLGWLADRDIPPPADQGDEWELEDCRDIINELWQEGCEQLNLNGGNGWVNEQGSDIHFYIDEFFEPTYRAERLVKIIFFWLHEHFDIDYVRPTSEEGRILADAIHDWFLPFADSRALAA